MHSAMEHEMLIQAIGKIENRKEGNQVHWVLGLES